MTTNIDAILRENHGTVLRYAMRLCISPADAEDAVQETLIALSRYFTALRGAAKLTTWLFVVTRNHCTRLAKKALRTKLHLDDVDTVADPRASPEEEFADVQLRGLFLATLNRLDEDKREVLIRRDLLQQSAAEVASDLGITVEAMKTRLHRARSETRKRLLAQLELV